MLLCFVSPFYKIYRLEEKEGRLHNTSFLILYKAMLRSILRTATRGLTSSSCRLLSSSVARPAQASQDNLAVIDLEPYYDSKASKTQSKEKADKIKAEIGGQINKALQERGFMLLKNHGIQDLIEATLEMNHRYFTELSL